MATKKNRVTIQTIADYVGLSRTTVGFVLSGKAREYHISKATEEKIRQAADELGYRPHGLARAMSRGRFDTVALAIRKNVSYLPPDLLYAATQTAERYGLMLSLALLPRHDMEVKEHFSRIFRELLVDGFLIDFPEPKIPELSQFIESLQTPVIWLNTRREKDCVYPDEEHGLDAVTTALIEAGHKHILYLGNEFSNHTHYSNRDREKGYRQAMKRAGLCARSILYNPETMKCHDPLWQQLAGLMHSADRPTAMVAYGPDHAGMAVGMALELGLRIPQDLNLVVCHDAEVRSLRPYRVALARIPIREAAEKGMEILHAKIEKQRKHIPPVKIPYTLDKAFFSHITPPQTRD